MIDFWGIIFPRRCPICGDIVNDKYLYKGEDNKLPKGIGMEKLICPHCYNLVPFVQGATCIKCGSMVDDDEIICPDCKKRPKDFLQGLSLLDYTSPYADRLMWDLKYNNKREYADFLALELARYFGRKIADWNVQVIVPIPVHPSKKAQRGYNQAAIVAKRLGDILDLPVDERALKRVKKTAPQKTLSAAARQQNLTGAFAAGKTAGRYESVMLLDDIYTTGATMQVCTRELYKAGVKRVYSLCCSAGRN